MAEAASTAVDDRWAWADRGNCVGHQDLFYNDDHDLKGTRRKNEELAKQLCRQCPVLDQCRRYAIEERELYGVWGGMTELERHKMAGRLRTG
ncbi:WhiB family transcriptional regulator [Dietzia natronolimnaea]|uniref:WhiB family transcriptional regulator n=1 Tax=Dietzia natronolimnaea TaxID=161920 RepID=UPI001F506426|nr:MULTISPECIES: WhiB family transcriptional regulator [Dietzia]MDZ4232969.1 WhiB family transcriptional regulator [Dietzia sp.]